MRFQSGQRVRLDEFIDDGVKTPVEFGYVLDDGPVNGVVPVQVDERYREPGDDGLREVPVEQVRHIGHDPELT